MLHRKILLALSFTALLGAGSAQAALPAYGGLSATEWLGKLIFFDQNLSLNRNQSCASCHAPGFGFTGPDSAVNATGSVYEGSVPGVFGNRKPPAAAYGGYSPVLYFDAEAGMWVGGMFWDGRATGWTLGDPLAEQAQGPFLNPREQALPSGDEVVARICASAYGWLFQSVWGADACASTSAYEYVARSVSAYEHSKVVNNFSSKYDAYLKNKVQLSAQEAEGLKLFEGRGNCSLCHISRPSAGLPALFTDHTYDNLGIPKNPLNPFYYQAGIGTDWVDEGLGGFLRSISNPDYAAELGKFKVPTLRNVDRRLVPLTMVSGRPVKAYGHNGYFKSLKEIVHFYNTRDVAGAGWPAPEVPVNVNTTELGNLGLSDVEEDAIVAFLKTLTDGWKP